MKILVASGSFKDVFNPIEACNMIGAALSQEKNEIVKVPFCDGGEYTYEVLKKYFQYEEEHAENILNAFGKNTRARYLVKNDEAHIISSEILRLYPCDDKHKNPLKLTDYGLGQMVLDAINKGYRKIKLYIGGTSTACCGMGFAQAFGIRLLDGKRQLMRAPILGEDLNHVDQILKGEVSFSDIQMHVIADGDAKSYEMSGITGLKVGKTFEEQKQQIVEQSNIGIRNIIELTGISENMPFSGAAGGLLFGIEQVFSPQYSLGGTYFAKLLSFEKKLMEADLVVTGEGRFDNTACGKTPASVAALAQKYQKPVIFVCGQIAKDAVGDYAGGIVDGKKNPVLLKLGITKLVTCQEYYDENPLPSTYAEQIEIFREFTPVILKKLFWKGNL